MEEHLGTEYLTCHRYRHTCGESFILVRSLLLPLPYRSGGAYLLCRAAGSKKITLNLASENRELSVMEKGEKRIKIQFESL